MQILTRILNLGGGAIWERIKDRFVLAAGDTYTTVGVGNVTSGDGIGGEATHTLTTSEIPKHTHSISHTHNINHRHDSCSFSGSTSYPYNSSGSQSNSTSSDGAWSFYTRCTSGGSAWLYAGTSTSVVSDSGGDKYGGGDLGTSYRRDIVSRAAHSHSFAHYHSVSTSGSTSYANVSSGGASTSTSGSNGSSNAHNNMPPYIVKYCWERIA